MVYSVSFLAMPRISPLLFSKEHFGQQRPDKCAARCLLEDTVLRADYFDRRMCLFVAYFRVIVPLTVHLVGLSDKFGGV